MRGPVRKGDRAARPGVPEILSAEAIVPLGLLPLQYRALEEDAKRERKMWSTLSRPGKNDASLRKDVERRRRPERVVRVSGLDDVYTRDREVRCVEEFQ